MCLLLSCKSKVSFNTLFLVSVLKQLSCFINKDLKRAQLRRMQCELIMTTGTRTSTSGFKPKVSASLVYLKYTHTYTYLHAFTYSNKRPKS